MFLDRPGNDEIQLNLLHNYQSNPPKYAGWHEFLRKYQPPMLIVWGKNDPFFTVEGAQAYLKDVPKAKASPSRRWPFRARRRARIYR
jgi:pimeloyl-ACP methyl ester carboxylesterase